MQMDEKPFFVCILYPVKRQENDQPLKIPAMKLWINRENEKKNGIYKINTLDIHYIFPFSMRLLYAEAIFISRQKFAIF